MPSFFKDKEVRDYKVFASWPSCTNLVMCNFKDFDEGAVKWGTGALSPPQIAMYG